jgi:hypothetical protein
MKILLSLFTAVTLFTACASNSQNARYAQEKNAPKFGNVRSYVEKPDAVMRAARAALDDLSRESDPPVISSIKSDEESVRTGWVYSESKAKYVEYKVDGKPGRKPLRVRRKYSYTVTPSFTGSQVILGAEEEVVQLDMKTGEEKGWKSSATDPAAFEDMARRLQEQIRYQNN